MEWVSPNLPIKTKETIMHKSILQKLNTKLTDPREQIIDIMLQSMQQMSLDVFRKDNEIFLNPNLSRNSYSGHNSYCKVFKRDIHFIFQEKPVMMKPSYSGFLSSFRSEIKNGERLRRFNGTIVPKSKYKYNNFNTFKSYNPKLFHGGNRHCILFTPSRIDNWMIEHDGKFKMDKPRWWHEYRSIEDSKIIGGFYSDDIRYHAIALAAHEFAHTVIHEIRRRVRDLDYRIDSRQVIHPRLIKEYDKSKQEFFHKYNGHKKGWQNIYGLFRKKYVNPFVDTESSTPKSLEQVAAEDIRRMEKD